MPKPNSRKLILASTSTYRAELLGRLALPFKTQAPKVDETALAKEPARKLALRLAIAKAQAVSAKNPKAWVIGSDQVASCDGLLLGKPHTRANAIAQLKQMRGKSTQFITALALCNTELGVLYRHIDTTTVTMRKLSIAEIEHYVDTEPAFDCAGSAKIEGLGISLCKQVDSKDPTALIGLPLIATAKLLRKAGLL